MIQRILSLIRSHKDVVVYIVFGVLTTLVNYAVYFPLYNFAQLSATLCNCMAWVVAVIFAFLTNKPFVFNSYDWSSKTVIPEFLKFVGCRLLSGIIESVIILIFVDLLKFNGNLWKIITGVLVIVLNYIGSKLLVFRNK